LRLGRTRRTRSTILRYLHSLLYDDLVEADDCSTGRVHALLAQLDPRLEYVCAYSIPDNLEDATGPEARRRSRPRAPLMVTAHVLAALLSYATARDLVHRVVEARVEWTIVVPATPEGVAEAAQLMRLYPTLVVPTPSLFALGAFAPRRPAPSDISERAPPGTRVVPRPDPARRGPSYPRTLLPESLRSGPRRGPVAPVL